MLKKKRLLISMLLVLVFLTLSVSPTLAADIQAAYAKIPQDLLDAFDEVGNNGTLDVVVWIEDNSTEEYQSIVSNIPEPTFETATPDTASYGIQSVAETGAALSDEERAAQIEAMQNYIMQKRQIAQAVYLEDNTAIANELAESGGDIVYISKYSPLVICNVTLSEAVDMAMSDSVLSLEDGSPDAQDLMAISSASSGVNNMHNYGYSGQGVKIGMIEPGVPDKAASVFDGVEDKIVWINATETNVTEHATLVAAVMVGQDSGIARGFSKLYCISTSTNTFYENVESLLSYGVNVINFSIQYSDNTTYSERSHWLDHIAYNHSVHLVVGNGNSGEDKVNDLAMTYNAISVGNIYDQNTLSLYDDTLYTSSAYNYSKLQKAYKPDLCAPGTSIYIDGLTGEEGCNGTSISAPHVTGITAILCSYSPTLLTKQSLLKSILLSSVATKTNRKYDTESYVSDSTDLDNTTLSNPDYKRYGSGIANAYNAKVLIDSGNYVNGSITASEERDSISIGNIQKGQTVSITLTFLKRARYTTSDHTDIFDLVESDLSDLDLYVCPVATYVGGDCSRTSGHIKSITSNNNVEKIIYTAPSSGEFVICIDKYEGQGSYEILYAVSWLVEDSSLQ